MQDNKKYLLILIQYFMKVFKMSLLFLLLLVLESNTSLFAQGRTVTGKVLDYQEEPLVGVTIKVA